MPDEVFPDIFRIPLPLPRNPLRAINTYLIRGEDRSLLIDTGMNRPDCAEALQAGLAALGVDLGRMDIFVTHCHSDHIGLVSMLKQPGTRAYLHPADAAIICDEDLWGELARSARLHGFPDAESAVEKHPGKKYLFTGQPDFTPRREGEELRAGRYTFRCIETPGHTPGHLCLYEPEARLLLSGDHILDSITPNISGWAQEDDPLGDFERSLDKISAYDVALVLPSHRNPISDCRRRIAELKEHHRVRTAEAAGILAAGPQTAYQVASRMAWDISFPRWEDFPIPQQWFATGEALAHLLHLERTGEATRQQRDGVVHFSLSRDAVPSRS
jgi:glyoxylase-like metal-dependent hydrolase (beta-lactamase superfamily II)